VRGLTAAAAAAAAAPYGCHGTACMS
jgi:hypothetical protein